MYSFDEISDGSSLSVIGIYNGEVFYLYSSPASIPDGHSQAEFDRANNSLDVKVFSYNLETGSKTEYLSDKSGNIDSLIMHNEYIYYHSRNEAKIFEYSVKSKSARALLSDIGGYVDIDSLSNFYNNCLFYTKRNDKTDAYGTAKMKNEYCYINLGNGSAGKVEYSGCLGTIHYEVGNYYCIKLVSDDSTGVVGYGKITKDDFWTGNTNALVAIK